MKAPEEYIVRTKNLTPDQFTPIKHVLNDNSSVHMAMLSQKIGLERIGIHLGRIPAGRESFMPHAHQFQEEFIFILEGQGEVDISGKRAPVGPGDFVGFPTDGAAHQLHNTGETDLLYLMGGESGKGDIVEFPSVKKFGMAFNGTMHFVDQADVQKVAFEDFVDRG